MDCIWCEGRAVGVDPEYGEGWCLPCWDGYDPVERPRLVPLPTGPGAASPISGWE